jgi:orotidine-5'-phosphate decarboxylase
MNEARSRLIVAVDVPDRAAALAAIDRLSGHVGCFKLGLEIFVSEGPGLVREIVGRGEKVFLDLKLHDIPNTVAGAVRSASRLGVSMITLHAAGGGKMLEAARAAAQASPNPPLLLAVTALTSLAPVDVASIGVGGSLGGWVERLADVAAGAGVTGLVASAHELPGLRARFGDTMKFVIPGIRPAGAQTQDQARAVTPAQAIRAGADFLVVGRPVLQTLDPVRAADAIVGEIAGGLAGGQKL